MLGNNLRTSEAGISCFSVIYCILCYFYAHQLLQSVSVRWTGKQLWWQTWQKFSHGWMQCVRCQADKQTQWMQTPHPEMCETKLITSCFPFRKKGGVIISVWWWQSKNWITEENGGQAKFNVIKYMFSIKSQFWVENFKPALLIICVKVRKDWVRKKLCKE